MENLKKRVRKKIYQQCCAYPKKVYFCRVFLRHQMAVVAQLVRVPDCGSVGRRFESDLPPCRDAILLRLFFV